MRKVSRQNLRMSLIQPTQFYIGLEQFSLPSEVESRIRKVFTEHYAAPGRKPW
jgi:hypothetical protein